MELLGIINTFAYYNINSVNMNVKLRTLTMGVLFFTGQTLIAQKTTKDTTSTSTIEEVVVLGYGKVISKPKDITASTTISAEVIENRPNVSFLNSIQGTAPGVTISSMSGSPGSAKIDVMIRGLSSLNSSTDPLYVIDGISYSATEFRNINVNDIESISIIRDAAGTSIYGNRGANGVVNIVTKKGKFNSALKVSYSGMTGVSVLPNSKYEMSDAKQILTLQKNYGAGIGSMMSEDQIANYSGVNTDWKKHFFKPSMTQQHDVSLTAGGQGLSSYTSLGYMNQGGIVPTTDFQRFTVRNNLNGKSANGKLSFNTQLALGFSKRNQLNQETNDNISNNVVQNPLHGSLLGLPTLAPNEYPTGQLLYNAIGTDFSGGKYIYVLEDILREDNLPSRFNQTSILASTSVSYKLTPDLTINNKTGVDYKRNDRVFARAPWSYLALAVAGTALKYPGFEVMSSNQDFTFNNTLSANYHKELGEHTLDLSAYFDYTKANYFYTFQQQNGLNPLTYSPGAGTGYVDVESINGTNNYVPQILAAKIKAGTVSYFGQLDYDFAGKYGVNAVVRRDASYRFVEDFRWGTFWSVGGRWNIDKENFMEGSIFDMLKLRASYGTSGNQNIFDGYLRYRDLTGTLYGNNPMFFANSNTRDLNIASSSATPGYNNASAYFLGRVANTELQWEEVKMTNFGLDFSLWNRKLTGTFDVYEKVTDKLFNDINLSAVTGLYSFDGNNGQMKNRGIELSLRYNAINKNDFKLSIFANGSYNQNKITKINGDFQDFGSYVYQVGNPAYEWYLVPYLGVNQETGEMQFLAADGSITEKPTVNDRRNTGKSFMPKFQGGFGFDLDVKNFYFNVLFSYQLDAWKFDNQYTWLLDPTSIAEYNVSSELLNAWTPENHTNIPALHAANTGLDSSSDRYLVDASFVKLRSLMIGYNLPKSFIGEGFVKSLKIFVQGENLAIWTKWKGYDPEGFTLFPLGNYPNPRTISFGTSIEF